MWAQAHARSAARGRRAMRASMRSIQSLMSILGVDVPPQLLNSVPYLGGWTPLVAAGLVDAWPAVQARPGPTWALPVGLPALLRIDAILVPAAWSVDAAWTLDILGSDHDALVADLRVRGR